MPGFGSRFGGGPVRWVIARACRPGRLQRSAAALLLRRWVPATAVTATRVAEIPRWTEEHMGLLNCEDPGHDDDHGSGDRQGGAEPGDGGPKPPQPIRGPAMPAAMPPGSRRYATAGRRGPEPAAGGL